MNGVERTAVLHRANRIVWRVVNGAVLTQRIDGEAGVGASELTGGAAMVWVALDEPATFDELAARLEVSSTEIDEAVAALLASGHVEAR